MKADRAYPRFVVSAKGTRWVEGGHPWIYAEEIVSEEGACENGALADAVSEKGKYLGTGFVSRESKIRLRLISRNANDRFDEAFWRRRLQYAWDYRRTVLRAEDLDCCRVVFGESDGFPGLTVDRFSDLLVTQTLSVGIEKIKDLLFPLLLETLRADGRTVSGIYERNDAAIRTLEGLEQTKGWWGGEHPASPVTEICENGIRYAVDVENGQKTGFFLDQSRNRAEVMRLAAGKRVLDCFTHTGAFALHAALGGAARVTAVDVSASALETARENARLNGVDSIKFTQADVFDLLTDMAARRCRDYDFIVLDPPAFTRSGATVKAAYRGYKEINLKAMRLLPRGGYLATCSCSHFMTDELFRQMLREAAADAQVSLRQLYVGRQGPDHPILWGVPETDYLEFYIFQVV